jgi:hypothetical protein
MEKTDLEIIIVSLEQRITWLEDVLFKFHFDHERRLIDLEPPIHNMETSYSE